MLFDFRKFDIYREGNRLEVKKAKGGLPNSIWESYSAMANCYGGVILLGAAENPDGSFSVSGLENPEKIR
ncbi:MAG: putative DNA binding domain-containing protein [Anaerolineaceae bacterium]|nr:putative DNA binding domain-containing protein [Anaerolineaceae bacterium]